MKEKRREPEVPEERVPVVECLDGHARITSKELAPIHSVKSGTLQNACSARPRVVADFGKSAHTHIARLMNSLAKGPKKNDDKSAVAMLKKYELHDRKEQPVVCRDTRHAQGHEIQRHNFESEQFIEYTTIGLRLSGHGAAEVVVNLTEELRHAETNPTCEIHESFCTSH